MEKALVAYLRADTDLSPAITTNGDTRIYPFVMPQDALKPAVVYQRIDTQRDYSHSGEEDVKEARLQVTLWASDYAQAKTVGAKLVASLGAWRGTFGGVTITDTELLDERDDYSDTPLLFGVSVDVAVTFKV
jgi:hypothetical protein